MDGDRRALTDCHQRLEMAARDVQKALDEWPDLLPSAQREEVEA